RLLPIRRLTHQLDVIACQQRGGDTHAHGVVVVNDHHPRTFALTFALNFSLDHQMPPQFSLSLCLRLSHPPHPSPPPLPPPPLPATAANAQDGADLTRPLPHHAEPEVPNWNGARCEPSPVIPDVELDHLAAAPSSQAHLDVACGSMLRRVRQRLLGNAIENKL